MTAAPVKFAFDLDLGSRSDRRASVSETAMDKLLADARAQAFKEGVAEGERTAVGRLAAAAQRIADNAAAMNGALDAARQQTLRDGVDLATMIGAKLAAHLLAREPTGEIEALIADCLTSLDGVPHLVIRCHTDLADAVRDIAERRIEVSGFTGRLVVLGDPEIGLGDCRIEWVDGGLVRDRAAVEQDIDRRITAYLAASGTSTAHGAGENG
jgi:flagellar assembly protein FliH